MRFPLAVGSVNTIREPFSLRHHSASQLCYHPLPMNCGEMAEQQAAQYLQHQGMKLVARNYRGRFGEIDLIMQEGATLVFIEVRLRSNADFGGAAESIDTRKQRRIIGAAKQYLTRLVHVPPCRFDVLLLDHGTVEWIRNAFEA